jgi:hypothetical protein
MSDERERLDAEILAWIAEDEWPSDGLRDDARFDALARRLFTWQYEHCAPYGRFCRGRGVTPERVRSWREIPPVPTGAFKETGLRCFPEGATVHTFLTSGTSSLARGALHLDTLEIYEASVVPSFRRHLLPELAAGDRCDLWVLAPSPAEAPHSSLSHMFGVLMRDLATPGSGFGVVEGDLAIDATLDRLSRSENEGSALAICGTAFAFVHMLDALLERGRAFELPRGSRILETGGFKGRSREIPTRELYEEIERRLGIPTSHIVNQYGMTELGSQFHDSVLRAPEQPRRKLGPPWTRALVLDPETGAEAAQGEVGAIAVFDLANTGTVLAVLTADLGRAVGDGFEVLGREPGAEERGCSIAADALLESEAR